MTISALAESAELSRVTVSRLEQTNNDPSEETVAALARALEFPVAFFFGPDLDEVDKEQASFRSLKAMTARERDASLSAASIAFIVNDWVESRFNLPDVDVPDMGIERGEPSAAARRLRAYWGIGEQPIGNMIDLLEAKGVRVFSLAENSLRVDAFSCWRDDVPYVFLNTRKSAERSRFDAAHELAHLCLHARGGGRISGAEAEADAFASSFLMPRKDVISRVRFVRSVKDIIHAKHRWGVSVAAMTYRLSKLGILSEWQARTMFIQISQLGYRSNEPEPMAREYSLIWQTVFRELWKERITKNNIAEELGIPQPELEGLVFGLAAAPSDPRSAMAPGSNLKPALAVDNERTLL